MALFKAYGALRSASTGTLALHLNKVRNLSIFIYIALLAFDRDIICRYVAL